MKKSKTTTNRQIKEIELDNQEDKIVENFKDCSLEQIQRIHNFLVSNANKTKAHPRAINAFKRLIKMKTIEKKEQ